ncbi:MAG: DUF5131 family protein [Dehalococcoidia bacterium]|nr:MAG: DUF5131 family protein [Dehalococcoidia bacterium]
MNKTKIEWAKNPDGKQGYIWNPITGCLNGCEYCYARKLANGRLRSRYLANTNLPDNILPEHWNEGHPNPFYPRFWPERLKELKPDVIAGKEKGIFVCDMSDLFGIGIPEDWTKQVLNYIKAWPEHRFYLLTKQPQNLIKWSPFPDNCWVGVTATDGIAYREAIHHLYRIEAKSKFISFEPLLQPAGVTDLSIGALDWVIIGAQTKPTIIPKYEWVVEIVTACDKAGIPVFLKNNLNTCEISDYPELLDKQGNMRQEMPSA